MSDTSISNVMAIRAEVIARRRALREAQPTAPPGVTPTAPASNFADTLNDVVAKLNETQEQEDVGTEAEAHGEQKSVVWGKSVVRRVKLGGRHINTKIKTKKNYTT